MRHLAHVNCRGSRRQMAHDRPQKTAVDRATRRWTGRQGRRHNAGVEPFRSAHHQSRAVGPVGKRNPEPLSKLQGWRGRVVSRHTPRKDKQYETQETAHYPRLGRRRLRPQHGHRLRRGECGNDQPPDNHCPLVQRVDEHYNAPVPEHGGFVRFLQLQRQHYRLKLSR